MTAQTYKVQTDVFEGPLELLLDLIEKRKLLVNDVSLAQVADDYIKHVKKMQEFSVPQTAHFVLVASTLLLIKSKSLLPTLELTEDEQTEVDDLERRLKLYKEVRRLKRYVQSKYGVNISYPREGTTKTEIVFMPDEKLTKTNLYETAKALIQNFPTASTLPQVIVDKVISLEDMIANFTERIQKSITMNFGELAKMSNTKSQDVRSIRANLAVSFLALLELVKQGAVAVRQESTFKNITVEAQETATPNYT